MLASSQGGLTSTTDTLVFQQTAGKKIEQQISGRKEAEATVGG